MKLIMNTVKAVISILSVIAPRLATALVFYLFCNPTSRASIRAREQAVANKAHKSHIDFKDEKVCVYSWGNGQRPVLLIHGWESRGSRFATIIEKLLECGYSPVAFDMPGHGDSGGKNTTILECNEVCADLQRQFGEFEAVIAHSFGVPCAFYAVKNKLRANKIVAIGGLGEFSYLIEEFSRALNLRGKIKDGLKRKVEGLFHPLRNIWETFSVTDNTELVTQPILIIHDTEDDVVQLQQAKKIAASYSNQARYYETSGYGHRNILYQQDVAQCIAEFIGNHYEKN